MIKRKSLIWLTVACLLLSLTGAAISLSNSKASSQISYAAATAFDTAQAVTVSGATVTAGSEQSGTVVHKGLLISPETTTGSYSGTLNAILPADSTMVYTFPGSLHENESSMWIDFTFRFTSVKTNEWFEVYTVMINGNYWSSMMVRDMEGHTRTTWKWGGGWFETARDDGYMYPQYGGSNLTAGYFKTAYVDGVLSIDVLSSEKNVTLAKFDSNTYSSINNDTGVCGFEKIDFSEGYILSFSANSAGNEATAPLLIESINGQSFETATLDAEPEWYTAYNTKTTISLSAEIEDFYTIDNPLTVPEATFATLANPTPQTVAKIELQKDGGDWQSVSAGYTVSEAGEYVIRYTAIEGVTNSGNIVEKSFGVYSEYFAIRDAVTVTGATVTGGSDQSGTVTHKGLLISPETATGSYSGTLNAILPADSTMVYTFPGSLHGDGSSMWIDFTFRFTSVKTNEWFEVYTVMINGNYWSSMMVRDMEGHTRTTWKWGGGWYETAQDNGYMYPQYGGSNLTAGYFKTSDVDGVLSIDVLSSEKNVTLAKFDSNTYSSINNDTGVCGFEKIDFSEGYILSFSANSAGNEATAPLLIENINGQSFADKVLKTEPDWYTVYATMPQISLSGEIEELYTAKEPFTVPTATYSTLKIPEAQTVAKIELQKDGGDWQSVSAGIKVDAAGNYVIKYTATDGGATLGNTMQKSFRVLDEYFEMKDAVTVMGAAVTAGADKSGTVAHKGLLIEANEKYGEYSGTLNGVFTGDAKIKFNFPGTLIGSSSRNARYIDFTFRFTDVNNSENYFEVIVFNDGWNAWNNAMAVRDKDGNIRTTRCDDNTIFDKTTSGDQNNSLHNLPYYGGNNSQSGYIELKWNGDVLEIHALDLHETDYCLAKFDCDEYREISGTTYGLKKIAFADGYKLSFMAKSSNSEATAPLLLEEINGISLTNKYVVPERMTLDSIEYIGSASVEIPATKNEVAGEDLGAGAKFAYSVEFGSFTLKAVKNVYPEVDLTHLGESKFTYSFLGQSIEQTVTVTDTPPVLSLNGIAEEEGFRKVGASSCQILKSDVLAVDLFEGDVSEDNIRIYIKTPGAADFTEFQAGVLELESLGVYEIKYVASDSFNLTSEIVRKIRVVDGGVPVISVDGTLPESVLVGSTLTLPAATATDDGQPVNIKVSVYSDNNIIEVVDGKAVFDKAGIYNIVYLAIDADGNESKAAYTVNVVADVEKPVISNVVLPTQVKLNSQVAIPDVSASDNADGSVPVSVKVYYGTSEIAVSSGKFTADKEGVYTIVFTATDETGNTRESIYQVKALKNISENNAVSDSTDVAVNGLVSGGDRLTAIILIVVGVAVALAAGVVAAIVTLKRRNKKS